jgi:RNA polymerase subunit RPABC4/transcription elongation factor Spt4
MTALLLRFGPDIPVVQHLGLLAHLRHGQPTWFTSDISLIVLVVLSAVEILGQKNPEARQVIHEFDIYLKPALAALTSLGVISSGDASFVGHTVHEAGFSQAIFPLISALLTYRLAVVRKSVVLAVFDHLDGTGLDKLISWLEEAWTVFGVFLLIIFPLLMLLIIGVATGVLFAIRKRLEIAEDRRRIACPHCQTLMYPCAVACPKCHQANATPSDVGWLGQSKPYPTADPANHAYRLVEKRRCPSCASRFPARRPFDPCQTCSGSSSADAKFAARYADFISRRVPLVLMVCFLMSLVPILGLIVASVYYRMEIVLPFSQYLPLGKRFMLRWGIRLLFLILILFQIIPLLGGLIAPLMAYISYIAYRNSYVSLMESPRLGAVEGDVTPSVVPE